MRIPITKPFFDEAEREAVLKPLETGWVVQGPYVKSFEDSVAEFTGAAYARATSSCTTALHLALIACGVGPGDEVVVPSFTFVATANAVKYTGAEPVFADIDLRTFAIDPKSAAGAVTARTKAVVPVQLFGLCADMDAVLDAARERGLRVVEDAACGIGATYKGKHAGTLGDAGCLSFHPRKSVTTGEGGMVITGSAEIARAVEILRDHGAEASDLKRHEAGVSLLPEYNVLGFNYRMTDLQGAVGAAQMRKLPWILQRRRELARRYSEVLAELPWLAAPVTPADREHGFQSYVCLYVGDMGDDAYEAGPSQAGAVQRAAQERMRLMAYLEGKGISVRQGTHAVHTLGAYRDDDWAYPKSFVADRLSLALPLYPQMSEQEQDYVIEALRGWR